MKDQHEKIKGYRDLSQGEIDAMNEIKEKAEEVGRLLTKVSTEMGITPDPRWMAMAKTELQVGFMKFVRAVAKPTTF